MKSVKLLFLPTLTRGEGGDVQVSENQFKVEKNAMSLDPTTMNATESRRLGWYYSECGSYYCKGYPWPCYMIRTASYCEDGRHSFCGAVGGMRWCNGKMGCHRGTGTI